MPMYVTLTKWTEQGAKAAKGTVDRVTAALEAPLPPGVKVHQVLWTMGRYDIVGIAEAPNDEAAMAATLADMAPGFAISETLRAFTADEMRAIIAAML